MTLPMTLLDMAGAPNEVADWKECALVLIDYQNEYLDGALPLKTTGEEALQNAKLLLDKARQEGAPVFHVVQHGKPNGKIFDPLTDKVSILSPLAPFSDEKIIEKTHPNSFHNTPLKELLLLTNKQQVVFAGFMSHMCVSASVKASLDLGFKNFVCHDACATRELPSHNGSIISSELLHDAAMAALKDRFATIVSTKELTA